MLCKASVAHTEGSLMIYLETDAGLACICGDALYNVDDQVVTPMGTLNADPVTSNNFVVSRREEKAAIKRTAQRGHHLPLA